MYPSDSAQLRPLCGQFRATILAGCADGGRSKLHLMLVVTDKIRKPQKGGSEPFRDVEEQHVDRKRKGTGMVSLWKRKQKGTKVHLKPERTGTEQHWLEKHGWSVCHLCHLDEVSFRIDAGRTSV